MASGRWGVCLSEGLRFCYGLTRKNQSPLCSASLPLFELTALHCIHFPMYLHSCFLLFFCGERGGLLEKKMFLCLRGAERRGGEENAAYLHCFDFPSKVKETTQPCALKVALH